MDINRIKVKNFKSFENLDVELGKFNVLIGANASGKSNFIHIFKFLTDIINSGLNNAVANQGGSEFLWNMNIGTSRNLSIKIISEQEFGLLGVHSREGLRGIKTYELIYEFTLRFKKKAPGFRIVNDKLTQKCKFLRLKKKKNKIEEKETLGNGKIVISRHNDKANIKLNTPEGLIWKEEDIFPLFLREEKLEDCTLLLEKYFIPPKLRDILSNVAIYDIDPVLAKKATSIKGKTELEDDGRNLSLILKNIIESEELKKFFKIVKEILPFIENFVVEKLEDKYLIVKLKERYSKNQYLPAQLISDGTVSIIALIIALYFEKKTQVKIFKKPERNIHHGLISKIVNMMKEVSQKKQIIVTTNNPEFVNHTDLENILFVSRDENGFSKISRPADKKKVKTFLENNI